jgi:hypothetical protein
MSTSRVLYRLAAAALAGLVVAATGFAAPAFAADSVDVSLNSVTSNATAGSRPDGFSVSFRNNTNDAFNVKVVFGVKLTGLTAAQVRIVRAPVTELPHSESGGQIVFTDPATLAFLPRGSRNVNYSIQFLGGAPSGRASLAVEAVRDNTPAGGDNKTINVKGSSVVPTKSPTAAPTTSSPAPTSTGTDVGAGGTGAPPTFAALPTKENALAGVDSTGVPFGLYVVGVLLLGVGGVILWLLFRQRPARVDAGFPTGDYDVVPPNLGYPAGRAPMSGLNPTAQLPNLRADTVPSPIVANPTVAGRHSAAADAAIAPPSDPWASQAGTPGDAAHAIKDPPV